MKNTILVLQEIKEIKENKDFYAPKVIDVSELTDPFVGEEGDYRGSPDSLTTRKKWKNALDVACVPIKINIPELKGISLYKHFSSNPLPPQKELKGFEDQLSQLAILEKLGECKHIIKFHGISYANNCDVQVIEWSELGNLKEIYQTKYIPWGLKVQIARDISKGIAFLASTQIFHHDLRCENVLVSI